MRELPEKLRVLNTLDPNSGDSLLVAEFKVCVFFRVCARSGHKCTSFALSKVRQEKTAAK